MPTRDYAAERDRARLRATGAEASGGSAATVDGPSPFKKRSFSGTLAAITSSPVGSAEPIKVSGDIACERYARPSPATGTAVTPGEFAYSGRLRIPRARSRGLIVGYEYRLVAPGDDVTAPLEAIVKFVGTPDGSNPDVVAVDFAGADVRDVAGA